MKTPIIRSKEDVVRNVDEIGFLPFFKNHIEGFSLEEIVEPEFWYDSFGDGKLKWQAWSWREEIALDKSAIYGKFFCGKAGFIAKEYFLDFCNYRRQGYDYDALYDEGFMKRSDKEIVDYLSRSGPILTSQMKKELGFGKDGKKGFDSIINRLQMQTYIGVTEFRYKVASKTRETYGWGVAVIDTAENCWGKELCTAAYKCDPDESLDRLLGKLSCSLPNYSHASLMKLIKG